MQVALGLLTAASLVLGNALFVAVEFSLVAVDRGRIEAMAAAGSARARRVLRLLERLSFHLSGAQLGISLTSLVLGYIAESTIAQPLSPLVAAAGLPEDSVPGVSIGLALALATATQLVTGELVPKSVSITYPLPVALWLSGPVRVYGLVFGPVIQFLDGMANRTLRRIGVEPREELTHVHSLQDLEALIRTSGEEGTLDEDEVRLLVRTIRFGAKAAADALIPRGSIVSLDHARSVADLADAAVRTGFTRFPVSGENIHDILGVVHAKDVFQIPADVRADTPVTKVMKPALVVPESVDLESLLFDLRGGVSQLAVVVDEHGSTAGVVTLEDILEEIVGDISDEHDVPLSPVTPVPEQVADSFLVDGSLHGDELAELTGFEMPRGDYKTLAGFLLTLLERIPEPGTRVAVDGWEFEVVDRERHRIALVRMTALDGGEARR